MGGWGLRSLGGHCRFRVRLLNGKRATWCAFSALTKSPIEFYAAAVAISRAAPAHSPETSLSPMTPAKISAMHNNLDGAVESPSTTIPKTAVPAAPMPVHTA